MIDLRKGDCLELMKAIPDGSVDLILCDLPYGILNKQNKSAQWDRCIPFELLWEQFNRVLKDTGTAALFASGMFTAKLMLSNEKMWRYNLVWKKGNRPTGFLDCKRKPLKIYENICVFTKKATGTTYNPQMTTGEVNHSRGSGNHKNKQGCYGSFKDLPIIKTSKKYPIDIIDFQKEFPQKYHSTQKPVALLEYLVKTYSNEKDIVLDNCMGSGSTGVACVRTNRNFIGMEIVDEYFEIAKERIEREEAQITIWGKNNGD